MEVSNTDVLIVGAGPVGLFSVFELGQLGIKSHLVDSLDEIGGQCSALYPDKPIYDIPAYPNITAEELIKKIELQILPFKPAIDLGQKVNKVDKNGGIFCIETSKKKKINAKCIIIAAGNGAFGPNRPPLENIEQYENISIHYSVTSKPMYKNKTIAIAGGGDSAVDWAIELSKITKKIFFIHRRKKLRAAPSNVEKLYKLADDGLIEMVIPYQLESIEGTNGLIKNLLVKDLDNKLLSLKIDYLLPFFGLSSDLGPIKNWELSIQNNTLLVDQSTCQTSVDGIYAIGDVCSYPGKLKLILTGFSEAATAAHSCYSSIFPNKSLHFEYSTTKGIKKI